MQLVGVLFFPRNYWHGELADTTLGTLAVVSTQLVGELRCLVSPSQLLPKAALQLPYSCVLYATVVKKTRGRVSHLVIEVMHFLWANRFLLSEKQDCHV